MSVKSLRLFPMCIIATAAASLIGCGGSEMALADTEGAEETSSATQALSDIVYQGNSGVFSGVSSVTIGSYPANGSYTFGTYRTGCNGVFSAARNFTTNNSTGYFSIGNFSCTTNSEIRVTVSSTAPRAALVAY